MNQGLSPLQLQRRALLRSLARDHPGEHPHTLALRLHSEHGHEISGRQASFLLKRDDDDPIQRVTNGG